MALRTLFVGDIHGCAEEFTQILEEMSFEAGTDRLLLTGDAFSRGPDPVEVWRTIREARAEMVLGNHDDRLVRLLRLHLGGQGDQITKPHHREAVTGVQSVAQELLEWLETVPLRIDDEGFLLVHAGINPESGLGGTTHEEFLTIRTWPPNGTTVGPRWHDHYSEDGKLLIFGHDAPGGLVARRRQDGGPHLIGLDSGCVYGGMLSAYILEEDRIVQVPSCQPAFFRDTNDQR